LEITHQQMRAGRSTLGTLVGAVAALALVAGSASPAGAASEATFDDIVPGAYAQVQGDTGTFYAGLMAMTVDGSPATGYCIDIGTEIQPGETGLDEVDWATSGVPDLDTVAGILAAYFPNGTGPAGYEISGDDAERAAATQAAIWHFTDGFDLTVGANDPVIEANYAAILAAAADGALPSAGQPDVSLTIIPPADTSAEAGHPVGPYVVDTTASEVTLTPSAGVTITDADGNPLVGPVTDGTQFFLANPAEGPGSVTAAAQATVHSGRVFVKQGSQRLILASTVEAQVDAEAQATWTPATTTTTTPPETTTTTTPPETTTTTAPPLESTTTTVRITPDVGSGPSAPAAPAAPAVPVAPAPRATTGSLPRTGQDAAPLVAVGLALLVGGVLLGTVARRRRRA